MRKLIPVLCTLFLITGPAFAGEPSGGGEGQIDCTGNHADGLNQPGPDNTRYGGYTVFPIQSPKRHEMKIKVGNETPDDAALADSLRMIFGLSSPDNPNCFRQPRERGLLRSE